MMLTVNQKCNALASVIGIFCHANNTPEKVVEVLQRLGVSISIDAVQDAIISLSHQSHRAIRALGQTLTAAYAYDNFDIDLKTSIPTIEKSMEPSLKHLTSGLLFPLPEGTTKDDLKCSQLLWERSRLNDELPDSRPGLAPLPDWKNLFRIHPQYHLPDENGMTCRQRWIAWKFLHDIVNHGPEYFRQFQAELQDPEAIEQVPLTKTRVIPARAMDICNSTVSGNLGAIANLIMQGGIGVPDETNETNLQSLEEFVVLFHGDLGSGERITHGQIRRAIEGAPLERYQFVVYVFGLFHLKMASADALWRIFIRLSAARLDSTSVMQHIALLRSRQTGKFISNPGFRPMHQAITHDGRCRRLNCWAVEATNRNPAHTDLDQFAASKPSFTILLELANHLALHYVASQHHLEKLRSMPDNLRDEQYANGLVINQYYLLYEELSYAMNVGDIGRVEACFAPWTLIFKATGKHKYAAELIKHVTNVHFSYPEGLK